MAFPSAAVTVSGVSTIAGLNAKGLTGIIEALVAANLSATATPTSAVTASATGGGVSGGLLAAGTYYFVSTETNALGETTAGPVSAQLTVAAGNIPQFTFPALKTGNTARNLYLTAVGGVNTGPFFLYATGITTTTANGSVAAPSNSYAVNPPTVSTTGLTYVDANGVTINTPLAMIRSFEKGNGQAVYDFLRQIVTNFIAGEGVNFQSEMMKLYHARAVFAILLQATMDIGTIMDGNPGTLSTATFGPGLVKKVRTQP